MASHVSIIDSTVTWMQYWGFYTAYLLKISYFVLYFLIMYFIDLDHFGYKQKTSKF